MPLTIIFYLLTYPYLIVGQLQRDSALSLSKPFDLYAKNNFDVFGSATVLSDTIVVTPHSPSHLLGAIWAKTANVHTYWEAEFSFRSSGAERGGIGLAFWYTSKRGLGGDVFGSIDQWDGLGLFFDSNTREKVPPPLPVC